MKKLFIIFTVALFWGCSTNNSTITTDDVALAEDDQVVVCGQIDNDKQTYPTLGDLHNDGATFLYYGPCYE